MVFNTLRTKTVAMEAKVDTCLTDAMLIRGVSKSKGSLFQRGNKSLLIVCKRGPGFTYCSVVMLNGRKILSFIFPMGRYRYCCHTQESGFRKIFMLRVCKRTNVW